jgi:hypothetical protein
MIAIMGILGGAIVLYEGPGSAVATIDQSFSIQRQPDGTWPEIPCQNPILSFQLSVGTRDIETTASTTSTTNVKEGASFDTRSICIIALSDGPLTSPVAHLVIQALQRDPHVEQISYILGKEDQAMKGRATDVVMTLDADDYRDSTRLGSGNIHATVRLTISDQMARSSTYYVDGSQAPYTYSFLTKIVMTAEGDVRGISTPNARINATAQNIGEALAETVVDTFQDGREHCESALELPSEFFPDYRPVDDAQFLISDVFAQGDDFRALTAWSGRLRCNESWWHGHARGGAQEACERIATKLTASGYVSRSDSHAPPIASGRTYRKGNHEVMVVSTSPFDQPSLKLSIDGMLAAQEGAKGDRAPPQTTEIFVRYVEHADQAVRERAFDSVIKEDGDGTLLMRCWAGMSKQQKHRAAAVIELSARTDSEHLVFLMRRWKALSAGQRARITEWVDPLAAGEPELLLLRANIRSDNGDIEGAKSDLHTAIWLAKTSWGHKYNTKSDAKKAAKKLGMTDLDTLPSHDWLTAHGFQKLSDQDKSIEADITVGVPLRCFVETEEGTDLILVGIHLPSDGTKRAALRIIHKRSQPETSTSMGLGDSTRLVQALSGRTYTADIATPTSDDASQSNLAGHVTLSWQ